MSIPVIKSVWLQHERELYHPIPLFSPRPPKNFNAVSNKKSTQETIVDAMNPENIAHKRKKLRGQEIAQRTLRPSQSSGL